MSSVSWSHTEILLEAHVRCHEKPCPSHWALWYGGTTFLPAVLRKTFWRGFSIFPTWECFHCTISKKAQLWLCLALPFLKYAIHHLLHCVLFTKWAVFFVFLVEISTWIWWTGMRFSTLDISMLQRQFLSSQGQQVLTSPQGKSLQHRMLHQKERTCVSCGNKRHVWHLPMGSPSWNGLGANNELLRTFKLF